MASRKMYAWMICKLLEPILVFVEHDYHTSPDLGGTRWALIEAMRDYIANFKDGEE